MTADLSEPPRIRVHKFEHRVAIKWPEWDCWWVVDPDRPQGGYWASRGVSFDGPDAPEWLDPTANHHADLSTWTGAIRRELGSIEQTLKGLERHPWG
jgi:hypothetical protein